MRRAHAVPVLTVLITLVAGCVSEPAVYYKQLSPPWKNGEKSGATAKVGPGRVDKPASTSAADPADGEFSFALPVSSVMFALSADPAKVVSSQPTSASGAEPVQPLAGGRGKKEKAAAIANQPNKSPVDAPTPQELAKLSGRPLGVTGDLNNAPKGSDCEVADSKHPDDKDNWSWGRCWNSLQPNVAPHPDLDYIFVGRPSTGLKLNVTPGSDPLTVKSLGSNWTNPSTAAVTRVGGEAAAGWTLAGPYGALVVVLGGEIVHARAAPTQPNPNSLFQGQIDIAIPQLSFNSLITDGYICKGELTDSYPTDIGAKAQLLLPVALDLDHSLPQDSAVPRCWHRFPKGDVGYVNSGWLYRLVEEPVPIDPSKLVRPVYRTGVTPINLSVLGIARADDIPALPEDDKLAYFPTSACHAMVLEITWWSSAVWGKEDDRFKAHLDATHSLVYHIKIADPHFIQKMRLTEGSRTITVGACGATATGIAQSNAAEDNFAEVLKQVQAVRIAQENWDKAQAKK